MPDDVVIRVANLSLRGVGSFLRAGGQAIPHKQQRAGGRGVGGVWGEYDEKI